MNILRNNNKYIFSILGIGIPLVLLLAVTSFFAMNTLSDDTAIIANGNIASTYSEKVPIKTIYCNSIERKNGEYENYGCIHNTIYTDGLEKMEAALKGYSNATFTTVSLCNNTNGKCATPAATGAETFNRMSGCGFTDNTTTVLGSNGGSSGNWTVLASWVSSCDGIYINVSNLKDKNSEINLSGSTFTGTTANNGDTFFTNITIMLSS